MGCDHDLVLNGACYYCGKTDLDGVALSPKPAEHFVPASRLRRPARGAEPDRERPEPAASRPDPAAND